MGQLFELAQIIALNLHDYGSSCAFVNISTNFEKDNLKNEMRRIWQHFLNSKQTAADIVRVNYIFDTHISATTLPIVRNNVEKYLEALYPAGILTDAYCILDDVHLLEHNDNRKEILTMLQNQQQQNMNVYLLSNLTSQNALIPNSSIAHTIAMLTMFKDFTPQEYVTGADASRYSEFYFMDNCYARHGQFLTAGSLNITVPQKGLRALLIAELLSIGKNLPPGKEFHQEICVPIYQVIKPVRRQIKTMEYLFGMALPEINPSLRYTRGQWIARIFGQRLDTIVTQAAKDAPEATHKIETHGANFYDLLHATSTGNLYANAAATALETSIKQHEQTTKKFEDWLAGLPNFEKGSPEAEKRRLSPVVTQSLWPYAIASEYMRGKAMLNDLQASTTAAEKRIESIYDFNKTLYKLNEILDETINEYMETARIIDSTFEPFCPRPRDYFIEQFNKFVLQNKEEVQVLTSGLTEALLYGDFEEYLRTIENFVESKILPSAQFNSPIMETMHNMVEQYGTHDIATALGDWVFNHRRWNIRLKTGFSGLHKEVNMYMPPQGAASVKERFEARGLGRMNIFADKNANRVAVLYHAGAFALADLYYSSLYAND